MHLRSLALKYGSIVLLILVAILTVLDVLTPLRITTDSFRYLNIMEYLNGYLGKDSYAAADFYPYGYPHLLQFLDKYHILNAGILVGLNIFSLLGASWLFTKMFLVKNQALFYAFVLLSFINIKHITLPVADQLFTFVMLASVLCATRGFEKSFLWFIPAILLAVLSVYLRTAGIVVFAGAILYLLYLGLSGISDKRRRKNITALTAVLFAGAVVVTSIVLRHKVNYLHQLALDELFTGPSSLLTRLKYHFRELGEMTINIPVSQLKSHTYIIGIGYLFLAVGIVVCYIIGGKVIAMRLYEGLPFWVFLAYAAMIFVWPFYDTRFLVPFIPFALYCLFPQFNPVSALRYLTTLGTAMFIGFGFVALAYSAILSVSKEKFLKSYGNEPRLTEVYRQHFTMVADTALRSAHDDRDTFARTRYLLDKYDK